MEKNKLKFTFPPSATNVLTANPGLDFTVDQLQATQAGTLVLVGTIGGLRGGCIDWLRYESDEKLTSMQVDGTVYGVTSTNRISNLNDFREKLQDALKHGLRTSFCYNTRTNKMSMLNIFPCGCSCKND